MNCYFWWKEPVEFHWLVAAVNEAVHDLFEIIEEPVTVFVQRSHTWRGEIVLKYQSVAEFRTQLPPEAEANLNKFFINYLWAPAHSRNSFVFVIDGNDIHNGEVQRCYFGHSARIWQGDRNSKHIVDALSRLYKACREMMYRLHADRVAHCRITDWAGEGIESEDIDADFMFQPSGRQLLNPRLEEGVDSAWVMNDDGGSSNLFENVEVYIDPSEVEWYRKGGLTAPGE